MLAYTSGLSQPPNTITYCPTLAEALPLADVVSLHVPLNDHTNKFFAKKEFAQMKKGACLINTARGGVVDEEALLDALESGQVRCRVRSRFYTAALFFFFSC